MPDLHTVKDVLSLWPARPELERDLNAQPGRAVTLDRIHKWAQSGVIPAGYHARLLRAAKTRGLSLTADDLVRVHDEPNEDAA